MESQQESHARIGILYAEDDEVTRNILCTLIERKFPELRVHAAGNGREGLELFRKHAPAIVITDINMPELDGIQMAREIRNTHPDTVIIMVSAYSDARYLLSAIDIGVSQYILKPIDHKKLFPVIEKSIDKVRQGKTPEAVFERLASFPQLDPNPVVETDMAGRIVYCNEAAVTTLRAIAGSDDVALILPADLGEIMGSFEKGTATACYREVTVGGAVFGENIHHAPQFRTVRIHATDITARILRAAEPPTTT